jgi:hypothetical protein
MDNKLLIVDIETNSLSVQNAHILELALANLNLQTGKVDLVIDTLVQPDCSEENWRECWFIENSGVRVEEIRRASTFNMIRSQIEHEFKHPITAYNTEFDFNILIRHGVMIPQPWPCLMRTCTPILKLPGSYGDYKYPKFTEAWHYFFPSERLVETHRAGPDAVNEARLAFELYKGGYLNAPD